MAHGHGHSVDLSKVNTRLGELAQPFMSIGGIVAATGILGSLFLSFFTQHGFKQFAFSFLHNFVFVLSIALGALVFVLFQHLTRAGWSATVRRVGEITMGTLPYFAVPMLFVMFMLHTIYHWTHSDLTRFAGIKAQYLSEPFLIVRVIFYFAVWTLLANFYLKTSTRQDETGDQRLTKKMEAVSPVGTILFAITSTFFAFDFLMALDYHWFSTMFGVYFFAGSFGAFWAFLALAVHYLQANGRLSGVVSTEHFHDIGKMMFAFTVFWAYIAFSQFMLIWYANIPEETLWYNRRQENGWQWFSLVLLFGHFVIPFLGMMSRFVKRRKEMLIFWAIWMLVMHWVDLYWLIMPEIEPGTGPTLGMVDICSAAGFIGLFMVLIAFVGRDRSLLASKDPRLGESLAFHNF